MRIGAQWDWWSVAHFLGTKVLAWLIGTLCGSPVIGFIGAVFLGVLWEILDIYKPERVYIEFPVESVPLSDATLFTRQVIIWLIKGFSESDGKFDLNDLLSDVGGAAAYLIIYTLINV